MSLRNDETLCFCLDPTHPVRIPVLTNNPLSICYPLTYFLKNFAKLFYALIGFSCFLDPFSKLLSCWLLLYSYFVVAQNFTFLSHGLNLYHLPHNSSLLFFVIIAI